MVGLKIDVHDIANGYKELLGIVLDPATSRTVAPRGLVTRETSYMTIVHHDPTDCLFTGIGRNFSVTLAAVEALQLVGGFSDPDVTVAVAPHYANFMDVGIFHGAYGPRTKYKVEHIVRRLQRDINTRRAVLTVWDDDYDLDSESLHDYPCTVSLAFQIRDGKLNMRTLMRSNDVFLGYPYDVFQFTTLQRAIARYLDVPVGVYVHQVDSFHVYEKDIPRVQAILDSEPKERRRLSGGIGWDLATDSSCANWDDTQAAAHELFYASSNMEEKKSSDEEVWFDAVMRAWWINHGTGMTRP